jgi:hypothetical protein
MPSPIAPPPKSPPLPRHETGGLTGNGPFVGKLDRLAHVGGIVGIHNGSRRYLKNTAISRKMLKYVGIICDGTEQFGGKILQVGLHTAYDTPKELARKEFWTTLEDTT